MKIKKLVDGPPGPEVRIALACLILAKKREPVKLGFTMNEGTDAEPELVKVEFAIAGYRSSSRSENAAIQLLLSDDDPREESARVYFYPTAPTGHVGFVEVDEENNSPD